MNLTAPRSVIVTSLLALACGCARADAPAASPGPVAEAMSGAQVAVPDPAASPSESASFSFKVGDFVVYRFSGDYRKVPITLTQRVVEVSDTKLVVDSTFDDRKAKRTVRARYVHVPGTAHELESVWRIDATGAEKVMTTAEFDKMMSETMLAADDNEGAITSERVVVTVGKRKLDCTRTSYRVTLGGRPATMTSLTSDATVWGDVGGEIKGDDGKVLYRAEMIDAGENGPVLTVSR